jgi:hypothetical protein
VGRRSEKREVTIRKSLAVFPVIADNDDMRDLSTEKISQH